MHSGVLGAVAQTWPVGAVHSVTALGGGSINGAYRVQADAGAFHLRVYRHPDPARAERELRAVALALETGVPTPRPRSTRGGDLLGTLDGRWAALFEPAPGAPIPRPALTAGNATALGRFLAELHLRLPGAVPFAVPPVACSSVGRALERLERIRDAILARLDPNGMADGVIDAEADEVDGWALERTQQRLAHLRASPLPDFTPAYSARFLHGDYHDGNVFFVDSAPASVIDWEQTRLAPRAWEIVRCLHLSLRLAPELCTPFLAAYRATLPLSEHELADGAQFYATLQERNVWTYESVYLNGNPGPRPFILPPPYVPFQVAWAASGLK